MCSGSEMEKRKFHLFFIKVACIRKKSILIRYRSELTERRSVFRCETSSGQSADQKRLWWKSCPGKRKSKRKAVSHVRTAEDAAGKGEKPLILSCSVRARKVLQGFCGFWLFVWVRQCCGFCGNGVADGVVEWLQKIRIGMKNKGIAKSREIW